MRRAVAAAAAIALLASGCGTKNATDATQIVPADAMAYVHLHGERPPAPAAFPFAPPAYAQLAAALPRALMRVAHNVDIAILPEGAVAIVASKIERPGLLRRRVRGYTVFAQTQTALDAVRHTKLALADSAPYRAASKELGDAPLTAYLTRRFRGDAPARTRWLALDVSKETVELRYRAPTTPTAFLTDVEVPNDAVAVVGLASGDPPRSTLRTLDTIRRASGIDVVALARAAGGPAYAYLEPGAPFPAVTLVATPRDPERARRRVGALLARIGPATISPFGSRTIVDLGAIAVSYGLEHGRLVVSTAETHATTHALDGLPDHVIRFAWTHGATPALAAIAPGVSLPEPKPLPDFLLYETRDGDLWTRRVSTTRH